MRTHTKFMRSLQPLWEGLVEHRWNEAQRKALQATIAARQPFLDFIFDRVNADGSKQTFHVSGEPMFNQACRFVGYRGIGLEIAGKK